ncbi:MAG: ABC transporter substrate-binding protein [Nitrospinae bacterium]|nr:ABC transporter substrate-binding protein [Nitrospinota bacterium]
MSCQDGQSTGAVRNARVMDSGEAVIGIVYPREKTGESFANGALLAVDEINARGGIMGKKLALEIMDDRGDPRVSVEMAKKIAKDMDIIAVIGHLSSDAAIASSLAYHINDMLFMAPQAASPYLTMHKFETVFRTISSDRLVAAKALEYMKNKGLTKLIIANEQSRYGVDLSHLMIAHSKEFGITVVSQKNYFNADTDFRRGLIGMQDMDFDAVFIAGGFPAGAILIRQIREMGFNQPIFTGGALNSPKLMEIAGKAAEGVVSASHFSMSDPIPEMAAFVAKYRARFKEEPEQNSARSYEAVSLLAQSLEKSKSFNPVVVASTFKVYKQWRGLTGLYDFTRYGDVTGHKLYLETVKNGKFELLID